MFKILKNKKGSEQELWVPTDILFWIFFAILSGFVAVVLAIFFASGGSETASIKEDLDIDFISDRLIDSKDCFAYFDSELKKTTFNSIDTTKFENTQFEGECLGELNAEDLAFKLKLIHETKEFEIQTSNWNTNKPIDKKLQRKKVLINEEESKGNLEIQIQNV